MADKKLEVAVLTTSGRWPTTGFDEVNDNVKVRVVLDEAIKNLHLAGTAGWVATVGGSTTALNQDASFKENGLTSGDIVLDFGPPHGGGGGQRA